MPVTRITSLGGRILSVSRDGVISNLVPDPQGNTVALRDSTGAITDTFGYWPYGAVRSHVGSTNTPFQFGGSVGYHRDTPNSAYVRARVLHTTSGRWSSRDPILEGPSSVGNLAPAGGAYVYVGGSPVGWLDRSGLRPVPGPVKFSQDVQVSCVGLNPTSSANCPTDRCEQCCNALAADFNLLALTTIWVSIGGPSPPFGSFATSVAAGCQSSCQSKCVAHPSGSVAIRDFASCLVNSTFDGYADGWTNDRLFRFLIAILRQLRAR